MDDEARDRIEVAHVRWKNGGSAEEQDVVSVEEPIEVLIQTGFSRF
jgi:hypothetical protein